MELKSKKQKTVEGKSEGKEEKEEMIGMDLENKEEIEEMDYEVVGRRLKNARKSKGYTQGYVAKELGVTVAYISRVERGNGSINIKRLVQLSQLFGTSLNYFLTGSVENASGYLQSDFGEVLKKCTPEKQRSILQIAKIISKMN